jgi:adenylate cyclase
MTMNSTAAVPATSVADFSNRENDTVFLSTNAFAETALEGAKRDGLLLAVRARWIALAIIGVILPVINFNWDVIYYYVPLALFALIGWAQWQIGKVGQSRPELVLIFCDLLLMTLITVVPNPFSSLDWPVAMQYRFGSFIYFFVLLSSATLAYSWRTIIAFGTWTAGLWAAGLLWVWWRPNAQPEMTEALQAAFGDQPRLLDILDPNAIHFGWRLQEVVVFVIVAVTLALTVRRSNELLKSHAASERERTNLARYFSPNVVAELSQNDEPLKQVRTQNVAVMFVDIVGFTAFADGRDPEDVIRTLRDFHGRMERAVFDNGGTLDKYLGDGLMATFGTPFAGEADAGNALRCAQRMIAEVDAMNRERARAGQPGLQVGFGLHFGPVVLGDIGANRLEFAVIGSTVNVASRLEGLSRSLGCMLVASEDVVDKAKTEAATSGDELTQLVERPAQEIRGIEKPLVVWTSDRAA